MKIKETLTIGAIANLFGRRMGITNIHSLLASLGLQHVPEGNKSFRVSCALKELFQSDKEDFAVFMNVLVEHHNLEREDIFALNQLLPILGYNIVSGKVKVTDRKEIIYDEPRPFDAYKDIEKIMLSAKNEVRILDPYVDQSLFPLYFADVGSKVRIKIITEKMKGKFKEVAEKFKKQNSNFEVRLARGIHDRFLMVDNRAWILGQSIKDAGNKPLSIIELRDPTRAIDLFSKLWDASKSIFVNC